MEKIIEAKLVGMIFTVERQDEEILKMSAGEEEKIERESKREL